VPGTDPLSGDAARRRRIRRNAIFLAAVLAIATGAAVVVSAAGDSKPGTGFQPAPDDSPVEVGTAAPIVTPESTSTSTSTTSSTSTSTSTTTTTIDPLQVAHAFPVDPAVNSSFTPQGHSTYRATDIFASSGCGTALLAPVTGVVDEVLANTYDPGVDDPATRGGNAVSVVGDDGVRYYLAHFQLIDPAIVPGARVVAGDFLGEMGDTGRAGACHVHFGLSLPCPSPDWWVRRGVVWPDEYLAAWKQGENLSPLAELEAWFAEYPDACASVDGTPYAVG
jgi:peptidoglycan LD-endopeptidase LytH